MITQQDLERVREGDARLANQKDQAIREGRFEDAFMLVGNEERHILLLKLWYGGLMDREGLRSVILQAWDHGPRVHGRDITSRRWVELFKEAGFVASPDRPKPAGKVTLYRGAPTRTGGNGMSWSSDIAVAKWFRDRWRSRGIQAELYTTTVPADAILAMDDDRSESEIVVNPNFLRGKQRPVVVADDAAVN